MLSHGSSSHKPRRKEIRCSFLFAMASTTSSDKCSDATSSPPAHVAVTDCKEVLLVLRRTCMHTNRPSLHNSVDLKRFDDHVSSPGFTCTTGGRCKRRIEDCLPGRSQQRHSRLHPWSSVLHRATFPYQALKRLSCSLERSLQPCCNPSSS